MDARKADRVAPESILGVELIDVALGEDSMPVKRAQVDSPWAHLAEHQPCIVLFCKGLGQVIVPCSCEGLCSDWTAVPSRSKYLAATGLSVLYMLKERTRKRVARLADDVTWRFRSPLITFINPGEQQIANTCKALNPRDHQTNNSDTFLRK
jgi:hypothetical protein